MYAKMPLSGTSSTSASETRNFPVRTVSIKQNWGKTSSDTSRYDTEDDVTGRDTNSSNFTRLPRSFP